MINMLVLKNKKRINFFNVKDHYWETLLHQTIVIYCILDLTLFIYFSIYLYFQMKVIWLKQLNSLYLDMREMFLLTILKQYYITIDHYYPECPRLYTIILSYLLVHMWNLITCFNFCVCGVVCLPAFILFLYFMLKGQVCRG